MPYTNLFRCYMHVDVTLFSNQISIQLLSIDPISVLALSYILIKKFYCTIYIHTYTQTPLKHSKTHEYRTWAVHRNMCDLLSFFFFFILFHLQRAKRDDKEKNDDDIQFIKKNDFRRIWILKLLFQIQFRILLFLLSSWFYLIFSFFP